MDMKKDDNNHNEEILIIGDPHFSKSNTLETDKMLEGILELIENKNFSFVVVLGDIMHEHSIGNMNVMLRVNEFIEKISSVIKIYILIGNHDRTNNKVFLTDEHFFNPYKKWKNVFIVDHHLILEWYENKICMMPFVPDGRFMEALNVCNINVNDMDIFFTHSEFSNSKLNKITNSKCDYWEEDFPLNIAGHIHTYENLGNLIYVGTPFSHNYGEKGKKGVYTLDKDFNLKKHSLGIKEKLTRRIKYTELENIEIDPDIDLKLVIDGPIKVIKSLLSREDIADKLKNVKILTTDKEKTKKKITKPQSNTSYIQRLKENLQKNKELKKMFEKIFDEEE